MAQAIWRRTGSPMYNRVTHRGAPVEVTTQSALTSYWLRVFPTEETYLQALVIANLLLLPPDPV